MAERNKPGYPAGFASSGNPTMVEDDRESGYCTRSASHFSLMTTMSDTTSVSMLPNMSYGSSNVSRSMLPDMSYGTSNASRSIIDEDRQTLRSEILTLNNQTEPSNYNQSFHTQPNTTNSNPPFENYTYLMNTRTEVDYDNQNDSYRSKPSTHRDAADMFPPYVPYRLQFPYLSANNQQRQRSDPPSMY
jgi:hypothetical protein